MEPEDGEKGGRLFSRIKEGNYVVVFFQPIRSRKRLARGAIPSAGIE